MLRRRKERGYVSVKITKFRFRFVKPDNNNNPMTEWKNGTKEQRYVLNILYELMIHTDII